MVFLFAVIKRLLQLMTVIKAILILNHFYIDICKNIKGNLLKNVYYVVKAVVCQKFLLFSMVDIYS